MEDSYHFLRYAWLWLLWRTNAHLQTENSTAPVTRSPGYWYGLWRARKLLFQILPSNQNVADGLERWRWKVGRFNDWKNKWVCHGRMMNEFSQKLSLVFVWFRAPPWLTSSGSNGSLFFDRKYSREKWNFLCIGKPKSFSSWEMERSVTSRSEIKCPTQ